MTFDEKVKFHIYIAQLDKEINWIIELQLVAMAQRRLGDLLKLEIEAKKARNTLFTKFALEVQVY